MSAYEVYKGIKATGSDVRKVVTVAKRPGTFGADKPGDDYTGWRVIFYGAITVGVLLDFAAGTLPAFAIIGGFVGALGVIPWMIWEHRSTQRANEAALEELNRQQVEAAEAARRADVDE
jgi:hypothetical protein